MDTYSALHLADEPSLTCKAATSEIGDLSAPVDQHQVPAIDLAYLHTEDSPVKTFVASPLYHPKPNLLSRIYNSIIGRKFYCISGEKQFGKIRFRFLITISPQVAKSARSAAGAPLFATEDCYDD